MKKVILIMTTLSLCWHLLSIVGNLPEELIVKILYQYSGLRHPIVNILLDTTKVNEYEALQKLPFSKSIYKFYLNQEKYSTLFEIDIINYINNKQCHYFRECTSYFHYNNPGYFIPRQFGRLYYNVLNDQDNVETKIHVDWKLNRSKRIIESIRCNSTHLSNSVRCSRRFLDYNRISGYFWKQKYTHKLMKFEKFIEKQEKKKLPNGSHHNYWICNGCKKNLV